MLYSNLITVDEQEETFSTITIYRQACIQLSVQQQDGPLLCADMSNLQRRCKNVKCAISPIVAASVTAQCRDNSNCYMAMTHKLTQDNHINDTIKRRNI